MIAVGVDQGGPVFRDALDPFWRIGTGVALDGVERQAQTAGAVQQTDAGLDQLVDVLPALPSCLGERSVPQPGRAGPAATVGGDFFAGGLCKPVPEGTDGPRARYLLCRSFSRDPQPEPDVRLSPRWALR